MFKKTFVLIFVLLCVSNIIYSQEVVDEIKPKDAYMMEDIKKYLTDEENTYFMQTQTLMEDFITNNKDLEDYLDGAIQAMLKGDKEKIEQQFAKLKEEIEGLIKKLNSLNPPPSLRGYHRLNIEALNLLIKKLDPATITNEAVQDKLNEEGDRVVEKTNKEIEGLIKKRQAQS